MSLRRSNIVISQWGWDFYTMRGGVHQGDNRYCSRFVIVVDIWRGIYCMDENGVVISSIIPFSTDLLEIASALGHRFTLFQIQHYT